MLNDNEIKKAYEDKVNLIASMTSIHLDEEDGLDLYSVMSNVLDLIKRQDEEYEHLLKIARKMHTWIFLNTGDEQAAYGEIGLSDEDNMLLGYGGQIELTLGEKERVDNDN